ncbi:hypothetical protein RZS08_53605, partial [Arthrospira platensis SPKY1]|nr:hypothetical protein [Arthrospira platensis SPKY1]
MSEFDVTADGDFSAVINILSRGPVYFYILKEGYTPVRVVKTLKELKGMNDIGTVKIASLIPSSLRYRNLLSEEMR